MHGQLAGGIGGTPVSGVNEEVCELQKYISCQNCADWGMAWELAQRALTFARKQDFRQCYLETAATIDHAIILYKQLGFCHIASPMGNTGHVDCEVTMLKTL